jgi:DNA-binding NarL/FixJ family response regulator
MTAPAEMQDGAIRVLIADDDPMVRSALTQLIQSRSELVLVGAATDAHEAISMAVARHPDVAVIDYRMPGGGDYATREIIKQSPGTAVLCLTAFDNPATESRLLKAGARELIVKGQTTIEEIIASIIAAGTRAA